jgi:hypothetical protein
MRLYFTDRKRTVYVSEQNMCCLYFIVNICLSINCKHGICFDAICCKQGGKHETP